MRTITKIAVLAILSTFFMSAVASADTVTLNPTDDTYVWGFNPDSNYGNSEYLCNGANPGLQGLVYTLLKFDFSACSGASIISADLRLYVYGSTGGWPPNSIFISINDADWDENTATWNNFPGRLETTVIPPPTSYGWWVTDVTSMVQDFVNGTYDNYGFQLWRVEAFVTVFSMRSREYSSNRPELVLEFLPVALESGTWAGIKAGF